MNTFKNFTLAVFTVVAALCSVARADIAAGTYSMEFDGSVSIWDISGTYSENIDGMIMNYTISVDPSGKITGNGSLAFDDVSLGNMDMNFTFSGTVKSSGTVTRVDLKMTLKAAGVIEGYDFTLRMSMNEKLEIDSATRMMVGTVSGRVTISVKGYGSESMVIDPTVVDMELPIDMDGSWDLVITATPTNTRIGGTGSIVLSNGSTYGFSLSGSYRASDDVSRITLKGGTTNRAMSFNLEAVCNGPDITPKKLKGKALGQSLAFAGN